jgi:hypothetical protein
MARTTLDFNANNAVIDFEEMKIIELPKKKDDPTKVYDLNKILQQFNGVEGITFKISTQQDVEPDSTEY